MTFRLLLRLFNHFVDAVISECKNEGLILGCMFILLVFDYRKAEHWPPKLSMQLLPKQLISNIGNAYLKNSTSVLFNISPSESAESLTKIMSTGYVSKLFNDTSDSYAHPNCNLLI